MKAVPAELVNCGTLAFGVAIRRTDGQVFGLTEHDRDATVSVSCLFGGTPTDVLLEAAPGFTLQSLSSTAGLGVDNTDIYAIAGDYMTRADILAHVWDSAQVFFFRYNWKLPASGIIPVKRGHFGAFTPELGRFKVEFRDLRQAFQQSSTWQFQRECRWRLGDARCGVDIAPLTASFTVTDVASQTTFTAPPPLIAPDDYYAEGMLTWTAGANAGLSAKVRSFAASWFVISEAAIYPIAVDDTFDAEPGCRKRPDEDCRVKFDNLLNFGGEKDKPTRDELIRPAEAVG